MQEQEEKDPGTLLKMLNRVLTELLDIEFFGRSHDDIVAAVRKATACVDAAREAAAKAELKAVSARKPGPDDRRASSPVAGDRYVKDGRVDVVETADETQVIVRLSTGVVLRYLRDHWPEAVKRILWKGAEFIPADPIPEKAGRASPSQ
jgi:hypothetical protein